MCLLLTKVGKNGSVVEIFNQIGCKSTPVEVRLMLT